MDYRKLGTTDLSVSAICLGSMTWGQQNSEAEGHAQLDYALARGVNFIDTAEIYSIPPRRETQGSTERIIGSWLAARRNRDKVIVATKVAGRGDADWLRPDGAGPVLGRCYTLQTKALSLVIGNVVATGASCWTMMILTMPEQAPWNFT